MIGIDEVGRGCWAGPLLVVAARSITELPKGLKDSKILSKKKREEIAPLIEASCDIGEGWVSHEEIDSLGLSGAMRLGVERALTAINALPSEHIIMDGKINYCAPEFVRVETIIKADALYPVVSAASIVAKVKRDDYMRDMAKNYPNYRFDSHVGYGTKLHSDCLARFGVSPIHRLSYKPVQVFL